MIKDYIINCRLSDSLGFSSISVFTLLGANFVLGLPVGVLAFFQIVIVCTLFSIYSFASNNHFDRLADRHNPAKLSRNPVAAGRISPEKSAMSSFALAGAVLLLSALWFMQVLPLALAALANITLYNSVFKRRPLFDLASHAVWTASFVLLPMAAVGAPLYLLLPFAFFMLVGSNVAELGNQIQDYHADRSAGVATTAVRYGLGFARALFLLSLAGVAASILLFYLQFPKWYILLFLLVPVMDLSIFLRPRFAKYSGRALMSLIFVFALAVIFG